MQADFIAIFVVKPLYNPYQHRVRSSKKNLHTDLLVDKKKALDIAYMSKQHPQNLSCPCTLSGRGAFLHKQQQQQLS